eukprot:SAG31_NODE_819_length_11811_cov_3.315488_2_plen_90_part_00
MTLAGIHGGIQVDAQPAQAVRGGAGVHHGRVLTSTSEPSEPVGMARVDVPSAADGLSSHVNVGPRLQLLSPTHRSTEASTFDRGSDHDA